MEATMRLFSCILFFVLLSISFAYADESTPTLQSLVNQNKETELKIKAIQQNLSSINRSIPQVNLEYSAAEKLVEISEKNLAAPTWMLDSVYIILGLIIAVVTLVGYYIREGLLSRINANITRMERLQQTIENEHYPNIAAQYDVDAVNHFYEGRYQRAIEAEIKAIHFLNKVGENEEHRHVLAKYSSNLGYYYAATDRKDKAGEAIKYALLGLATGKSIDHMNLIDNYLYIIMKLSKNIEDLKTWVDVHDTYKDELYKRVDLNEEEKGRYGEFQTYCQTRLHK
jgi:tetratricopeptide (TPR) repeat protein